MTIFDYLKSILVTKNKKAECGSEYAPFMINRWLSFLSPGSAIVVNESTNNFILEDKQYHYKYLLTLFPRLKSQPRIDYVKKVSKKTKKEKEEDTLTLLARHMELSTREVRRMLDFQESLKN